MNETEAGLSAPSFTNVITEKYTKSIPIILYSDSCCGQIRNSTSSNQLLNYSITRNTHLAEIFRER